jgi:hypothetical protein
LPYAVRDKHCCLTHCGDRGLFQVRLVRMVLPMLENVCQCNVTELPQISYPVLSQTQTPSGGKEPSNTLAFGNRRLLTRSVLSEKLLESFRNRYISR